MTVQTITQGYDNQTDSALRAWGSAVNAALVALGFVQTADTGQVNWTTVVHSASLNTAVGYEIWRFNDSLQASAPVYFKLEFGNGGGFSNSSSIWITLGTGSDGAGTITGTNPATGGSAVLTPRAQFSYTQSSAIASTTSYLATDTDKAALLMALWPNAANCQGYFFLIERTRDWAGNPTADGVSFMYLLATGGAAYRLLFAAGTQNNAAGTQQILPYAGIGFGLKTQISANVAYPQPVQLTWDGPRYNGFSKFLFWVMAGDTPTATTFTMSIYGESHTVYSAGNGSQGSGWNGAWGLTGGIGNLSPIVRID